MISRLATVMAATALTAVLSVAPAAAEVKVGVILALSGSAASQGIPQKQALELAIPKAIGGQKVTTIIMDEATDPAVAARNAKKLVEEDKVDVIIGGSITPASIAIAQITSTARVPFLPNAPVRFSDSRDEWLFNVPPPPIKWIVPTVNEIKKRGAKTVGFLGFSDAWGDITLKALQSHAEDGGYEIVAEERYARADTSITGQVLRLMAAKPDAIFLGVAGSPGVLANVTLKERGYTGPILNTVGVFNADFLTLGGAELEGIYASIGAIVVGESLPDSEPRKAVVRDFVEKYNAAYGKGKADAIAGFGYDAGLLATKAIEKAVSKATPGTPEFRTAVAAGMRELDNVPGTHSIYKFDDPSFPWGVRDGSVFLVQVKNGKWVLAN